MFFKDFQIILFDFYSLLTRKCRKGSVPLGFIPDGVIFVVLGVDQLEDLNINEPQRKTKFTLKLFLFSTFLNAETFSLGFKVTNALSLESTIKQKREHLSNSA